jgi:hypothetical protein
MLGVTDAQSTENQVLLAIERIRQVPLEKRIFLFVNISAIHQPNCVYLSGATRDTLGSHAAALEYEDRQLPPLISELRQRAPMLAIICSDHGTAYGEEGYSGHRLAHSVVWDVPYAELLLERASGV